MDAGARADFIRANTEILRPRLIPELALHLASESVPLWLKTEEELDTIGLPPPFWAFAWAGGQALARYLLDTPQVVRGGSVLDLASGSGLVALAAAKAGAREVVAADIDAFARSAIAVNAALNDVKIEVTEQDVLAHDPPPVDCLLIGDLFYEKTVAARAFAWAKAAAARGSLVLIGDPRRSYLPRGELEEIAVYQVPVTRDLEDAEIKHSAVWRLKTPRDSSGP